MTDSSPFSERIKQRRYADYLASLCMEPEQSNAYLTLHAVADELARIRYVTSDPSTGLIRLMWWKEAFNDLFDHHTIRGHELLEALAPIMEAHQLPKASFMMLIQAHEQDLEPAPPATIAALEDYAQQRTLPLWELAAQITHTPLPEHVPALASATGIISLLADWPLLLKHGVVMFPEETLRAHGTHAQALIDGKAERRDILTLAKELARDYPIAIAKAETQTHPQLMSAMVAARQQRRLAKRGYLSTPLSPMDYIALWHVTH